MIFFSNQAPSSMSKYFVVQRIGSLIILRGAVITLTQSPTIPLWLVLGGLVLKIGIAPLHWWAVELVPSLNWIRLIIFLRAQKVLPIYLLFKFSHSTFYLLILTNLFVGLIGLIFQSQLKLILAYFSIISSSWLLVSCPNLTVAYMYLIVFFLGLRIVHLRLQMSEAGLKEELHNFNIDMVCLLGATAGTLSLAGFPPFLGFYVKVIIIRSAGELIPISLLSILIIRGFGVLLTLINWSLRALTLREGCHWERGYEYWNRALLRIFRLLLLGGLSILSSSNCA